jgi:hypothetical protein
LALRYGALNMVVVMDYRDLRCGGNLRCGGRHYERSECCLGTASSHKHRRLRAWHQIPDIGHTTSTMVGPVGISLFQALDVAVGGF